MKLNYIFFFLNLLSSLQLFAVENSSNGIFVKIKPSVNSNSMDNMLKKYGLNRQKYYSQLGLQHYAREGNIATDEKLQQACVAILKIPGVEGCEQDLKLKSHYTNDDLANSCVEKKLELDLATMQLHTGCKLIDTGVKNRHPGLSPFWAQEYTGADLARKLLGEQNYDQNIPSDLIHILDSSYVNHQEYVQNLIYGPKPSAVIPTKVGSNDLSRVTLDERQNEYISSYVKYFQDLIKFPSIINNSMSWEDSEIILDIVKRLAEKNVIFVTSAGNDGQQIENKKVIASRNYEVLVVASSTPWGTNSTSSNFGEEVAISAPSNNEIISYNDKGKRTDFGGTSGATPQVSGALAAFELVSQYHPSAAEFKKLLTQTAIKTVNSYDQPQRFGPGILNTYKIVRLAFRLKENCNVYSSDVSKYQNCIKGYLSSSKFYGFDSESADESKKVLGACFDVTHSGKYSCQEKKVHFQQIMQQAFLNPQRSDLWKGIACVYRKEGFEINAQYFENLVRFQDRESYQNIQIENILAQELIPLLLGQPAFIKRIDEAKRLVEGGSFDVEVVRYVLSQNEFIDSDHLLDIIVKREKLDSQIAIIRYLLGQSQFSDRIDLIEKFSEDIVLHPYLVREVLSQPHFSHRNDLVEKMIKGVIADEEIKKYIFLNPAREQYFMDKYQTLDLPSIRAKMEAR